LEDAVSASGHLLQQPLGDGVRCLGVILRSNALVCAIEVLADRAAGSDRSDVQEENGVKANIRDVVLTSELHQLIDRIEYLIILIPIGADDEAGDLVRRRRVCDVTKISCSDRVGPLQVRIARASVDRKPTIVRVASRKWRSVGQKDDHVTSARKNPG